MKLVDPFDAGSDRDAKFDDDAAGFLGEKTNDTGVDMRNAVLAKDANNVTHLLVGNAPVEVKRGASRTKTERILEKRIRERNGWLHEN